MKLLLKLKVLFFSGIICLLPQLAWALNDGDTIAVLELKRPTQSPFVLHGTIPIPAGIIHDHSQEQYFAVQSLRGTSEVLAQSEIVSRYPNGDASVIEIIAPVAIPSGQNSPYIQYKVVYRPHTASRPALQDLDIRWAQRTLYNQPGLPLAMKRFIQKGISFYTEDAFGNVYHLSLFSGTKGRVVTKIGDHVTEMKLTGYLTPVAGPGGNRLPHMQGVIAYVRVFNGENKAYLDIIVHNGPSGMGTNDPVVGNLVFKNFKMEFAASMKADQLVHDPSYDSQGVVNPSTEMEILTILKEIPGKLNVLQQGRRIDYRFAFVPDTQAGTMNAALTMEGQAFAIDARDPVTGEQKWSWYNEQTANLGPLNNPIPNLDNPPYSDKNTIRNKLAGDYNILKSQLEAGVSTTTIDWEGNTVQILPFPREALYGGKLVLGEVADFALNYPGGTLINPITDFRIIAGSFKEGLLYYMLMSGAFTLREKSWMYTEQGNQWSGENTMTTCPSGNPAKLFYLAMPDSVPVPDNANPWGFNNPAYAFHNNSIVGYEPSYYSLLFGQPWQTFETLGWSHKIRGLHLLFPLIYFANDSLAKDTMVNYAEQVVWTFTTYPQYFGWNNSCEVTNGSLLSKKNYAQSNPHKSVGAGREDGWASTAAAVGYAVAPLSWRNNPHHQLWYSDLTDTFEQARVLCDGPYGQHGVIGSKALMDQFPGSGNNTTYQIFEKTFLERGLMAVLRNVYAGVDEIKETEIKDTLQTSYANNIVIPYWSVGGQEPVKVAPVRNLATGEIYCADTLPPSTTIVSCGSCETGSTFAESYKSAMEHNNPAAAVEFLERSAEMAGGLDSIEQRFGCGWPWGNGTCMDYHYEALLRLLQEQAGEFPSADSGMNQ